MENIRKWTKNPAIKTEEEIIEGLKRAEDDIKNGRFITFDEWCRKMSDRYGI